MPNRRDTYVGYVEDAEEDAGSSIGGIESTRKYAISEAPRSPERANTGKSRRMRHRDDDSDDESASSLSSLTDSDSTPRSGKKGKARAKEPPRRSLHKERERERERRRRDKKLREEEEHRKARADAMKDKERDSRTLKKTRPPGPKHPASQPIVQQGYRRGRVDDAAAAYGVQQPAASGSRPRAQTRPASYYAGQPPRPPMSNMGWAGPPPPPPFPAGSFPHPHMFPGPGPGPGMVHAPPPPSPMGGPPPMFFDGPPPMFFDGPPPMFFDGPPMGPPHPGHHLRHRFDKRPSSAMGFHSPPSAISYLPEEYDDEPSQQVVRRPTRPKKSDEDRKKMPPPDFIPKRTQSARPTTAPFKPPPAQRDRDHERERERPVPSAKPPASHRRSVGFVDEPEQSFDDSDFLGEEDEVFHEASPDQRRTALTRARRNSVAYDAQPLDIVPANNRGRGRRGSMYGPSVVESGGASLEEDKYLDALRYQEEVSGVAPTPLTAETLRKVSKRGEVASSRSTRSSASRDESEYKRSNTTGITRSSSGHHDDFTIKVSGSAVVRVSGAEIECNDGGEITFSSGRAQSVARANSDRESTVYQIEDAPRSSRMERKALAHRPRASSQSDSQSRYAPSHAPFERTPYGQIEYEHAPYDPALAASNFY